MQLYPESLPWSKEAAIPQVHPIPQRAQQLKQHVEHGGYGFTCSKIKKKTGDDEAITSAIAHKKQCGVRLLKEIGAIKTSGSFFMKARDVCGGICTFIAYLLSNIKSTAQGTVMLWAIVMVLPRNACRIRSY